MKYLGERWKFTFSFHSVYLKKNRDSLVVFCHQNLSYEKCSEKGSLTARLCKDSGNDVRNMPGM